MRTKFSKLLSILLCLVMALGTLPTVALAASTTECSGESCTHQAAITVNETTTHYDTLAEAIAAVSIDGTETTIKMLADITGMTTEQILTITSGQNVVLDMAGHSITVASDFTGRPIVNNGTLKVTGNGTIDSKASESGGYGAINNFGTLTIENGTFRGATNADGSAIYNHAGATLTINDGIFDTATRAVANVNQATINGGLFTGTTCSQCNPTIWAYTIVNYGTNARMVINGGTFIGTQGAVSSSVGYLEVNGGKFETQDCSKKHGAIFYALYAAGEAGEVECVINGGTFETSGRYAAVLIGNDNKNGDGGINAQATAYVKGGTFTAPEGVPALKGAAETGDPVITGGTFSSDVSAYVVAGMIQDGNGAIVIDTATAVAEVNGVGYNTLAAAIDAAKNGDTVTLLADIYNPVGNENYAPITISLPAGVTLNGNNHTITGDVSIHVNPAGGTIRNVEFVDIHNEAVPSAYENSRYGFQNKVGKLTAIYGSGLTGKLTVTSCTFDGFDWEAIQTTPKAGAEIVITDNTFTAKDTQPVRNIHVESDYNVDFSATITHNMFYNGDVLKETALEVYYPADPNKVTLSGNFIQNPIGVCIQTGRGTNNPDLAVPFANEEFNQEVYPAVKQSLDGNYFFYLTVAQAIYAGVTTVTLANDVTENIVIPKGKTITLNGNGKTLTGTITNNGTLKIIGGTFTTEPDPEWIPDGYIVTENAGEYTVSLMTDDQAKAAGYVARYGSSATSTSRRYYKTLTEGFAVDGSLHLLTNVSEDVSRAGMIDLFCDDYTFTGSLNCTGKTLYVNNGTAVLNSIDCKNFYAGYSDYTANVTVKGGTATGNVTVAKNAALTIEGGTFTGTITVKTGGSLTIKGGTFSSDPTAYVAGGYKVTKNNDGTWTVFYVAPYVAPTYSITVDSAKHGDVIVSPKNASKGATVTITVESDKGYTLETLTVTDKNGDEIELTNKGDGKYTFTMPAGKVYVEATFMEDNSMLNFFVDVFPGDYYYDAVLWAAENGITGGVDDTHFAPNATCTRAQAVTFLWRAAGSPAPKSSMMPFTDVPAGSYYETAVLWAVENGITKGTSDTTFSPNATCTRGQIVSFLYRAAGSPAAGTVNPFTDVAADAYYNTAVLWAAENGITGGTGNNAFSPNADCTRAQIVTFLWRALAE